MITIRNLTLRRGTKVVLQGANLTLHAGEKVGLIGRNGAECLHTLPHALTVVG